MKEITNNEAFFILSVFKAPEVEYNARSMAKRIGISPMGALKIAKRLVSENILISRELGRAHFYQLDLANDYVRHYVAFLLKREAEQAHPYIKVWVNEIKKIKNADAAILFGSVLRKYKEAKDVDVVFLTDKRRFSKLKKEIGEINLVNVKRLHPVYQTREDFIRNVKKGDKVVLDAIKGIVVLGEDKFIRLLEK